MHGGAMRRRLINPTQLCGAPLTTSCIVSNGAVGAECDVTHSGTTPATPTAPHGQAVQKVLGEHGEGVVVAAEGLAGGRPQAGVVAPRVAACVVVPRENSINNWRDGVLIYFPELTVL